MKDGEWVKKGEFRELVEPISAILPGSNPSDIIAINRDHSELVKFEQACDDYQVVRQKLHDMFKNHRRSADGNLRNTHASIPTVTVSHPNDASSNEELDKDELPSELSR
jgi:hypothetical protein